jgi:nucleoside-diphosphate-sugar epimerase
MTLSATSAGLAGPSEQNPDGPYGWSKLMGENQLPEFAKHCPMNGGRVPNI